MTRLSNLIDEGALADHVDVAVNQDVVEYLNRAQPSCHSDNGSALIDAATKDCGEWIGYSPSFENYKYVALITNKTIFALGMGQDSVYFKLPDRLHATALATGALRAEQLGHDWVEIKLFRSDWPAPDVPFWTRKAYAAARGDH